MRSLVRLPELDIVVECTGSPVHAVDHVLAAIGTTNKPEINRWTAPKSAASPVRPNGPSSASTQANSARTRSADQRAGRMSSLRPDDSPAKVIDEIGIKGKGVKVVPIKGEERPGILEEAADVRIEGVTANEAVNLLYRLEKGSRPVVLKKVGIKVRFDDPARVDLAMTVALLKPLPGQQK